MKTVNFRDFRSNLKYWFDRLICDKNAITIKCGEGKELALVTLEEYNSLKETV